MADFLYITLCGKNDTSSTICNKIINYLQNHFGSNVIVVFDEYSDDSKNIKAMEQLKRAAAFSTSYEVRVDETMIAPITLEKFLSNRSNAFFFIKMLIEKLESVNIATKQARDDANVLIIETAIAKSAEQKITVLVWKDIDLLVILIGQTHLQNQEIFHKKMAEENIKRRMYYSRSFDKLFNCKKHILFSHVLTGCDTTSSLFKKGKLKIIC